MKPKILIIEDQIRMAQLLSMELNHEGYQTDMEADGEAGLEKIRNGSYDAVLLDFMLPGMDGKEVCTKVRAFSNIPIIVLTARDDVRSSILEAGANECLQKSFSLQAMLELLQKFTACRER